MLRHYAWTALRAGISIVHHQAQFDDQSATLGRFVQHAKKLKRRVEYTREAFENWNGCGKRLDQMRSVLDQAIAFLYCLTHESKLAVFQVTDSTMCHVGGCRARA